MIPYRRFLVLGTAIAFPIVIGPSLAPAQAGHDQTPCSETPVVTSTPNASDAGGELIHIHLTKCANTRTVGPHDVTVKDQNTQKLLFRQRLEGEVVGSQGFVDVEIHLPPVPLPPEICVDGTCIPPKS